MGCNAPRRLPTFTPGDLKHGFQVADHAGWIKLDGRAVTTLTVTQQAAAATLGFTTNFPLGDGAVFMQSAAVLGSVSGGTLTQAMLPAVNLTAASGGAHTHVTDSQGDHAHPGARSVYAQVASSVEVAWDRNEPDEYRGAHTHTALSAGAHTHTVALGGTGATIVPKNISATAFVYLGVQ